MVGIEGLSQTQCLLKRRINFTTRHILFVVLGPPSPEFSWTMTRPPRHLLPWLNACGVALVGPSCGLCWWSQLICEAGSRD
ncbi:hypothetical protein COCON_G00111730 [Conger conger]|uniref:Uncharacterized protein n=1 Tax=Conger conger TaxID=82655 RepID=A0A9Q1DJR2_CONCO|nr:hypothetical protein COCON_G00111730 [Conger conger]